MNRGVPCDLINTNYEHMKRSLSLLMVLPLFMVFFNNTVNRHQHILSDGMVIEHSHPFRSGCCENSDPVKRHQHSDWEFLYYAVTTDAPVVLFSLIVAPEVFRLQEADLFFQQPAEFYFRKSVSLSLLRAPPC